MRRVIISLTTVSARIIFDPLWASEGFGNEQSRGRQFRQIFFQIAFCDQPQAYVFNQGSIYEGQIPLLGLWYVKRNFREYCADQRS
jgi:hypothetical protein